MNKLYFKVELPVNMQKAANFLHMWQDPAMTLWEWEYHLKMHGFMTEDVKIEIFALTFGSDEN